MGMVRSINEVIWDSSSNGTSNAIAVDVYPLRTIQVVIDAAATVSLQGSEDLSNWYEFDSLTASGYAVDNNARLSMRAVISGATGNVKVIVTGNG